MSEKFDLREPLNPRTHMAIVGSTRELVRALVANDEANGQDPTLLIPEPLHPESPLPEEGAEPRYKPVYELYPKFEPTWTGRFISVPGGEVLRQLSVHAPVNRNDNDQTIYIRAMFAGGNVESAGAYIEPSKTVAIPLAEALPETIEVPELKPEDQAVVIESQMSEAEGQALLGDLADILSMQT